LRFARRQRPANADEHDGGCANRFRTDAQHHRRMIRFSRQGALCTMA
jgi:hypothetical protein